MLQKLQKGRRKSVVDQKRWTPGFHRLDRGFTLLEIMVAIFIFAVVVTTIFFSYDTLFSGNKAIDRSTVSYEMAKNCLDRMITDLKSVYVSLPPEYSPPDFDDSPDRYRIVGETSDVQGTTFPKLRFTSLAHVSFRGKTENGISEIVYYAQAADDGNYVLKRSDRLYPYPALEENAGDPVLCKDVKSLVIKYYDESGAEHDFWDSDTEDFGYSTPKSIGIKLELDAGSQSLWLETIVTLPVFREKKE